MTTTPPARPGRDRARPPDLVCLSHLRWNFVFQRPQHLMSRFARERRVLFVEEPLPDRGPPRMEVVRSPQGVLVATPRLPAELSEPEAAAAQRALLDALLRSLELSRYALWYYTPMALPFTRHLSPVAVAYDCMDELSLFRDAHPALLRREAELLDRATVVFTGGVSLWEAKRGRHRSVHAFPSSVEVEHFRAARGPLPEPADQRAIPRPRAGFVGVVDERMDLGIVAHLARARPDLHLVVIGPVAKISPADLPRAPNLHWLGQKAYEDLPAYLAGWDVALMPFALNDATRFISPTKTPEYLAAGRPVVSTPIRDVVRPYGEAGLVRIAGTAEEFVTAVDAALAGGHGFLAAADALLARTSWDETWRGMRDLLESSSTGAAARRAAAASEVSP